MKITAVIMAGGRGERFCQREEQLPKAVSFIDFRFAKP